MNDKNQIFDWKWIFLVFTCIAFGQYFEIALGTSRNDVQCAITRITDEEELAEHMEFLRDVNCRINFYVDIARD